MVVLVLDWPGGGPPHRAGPCADNSWSRAATGSYGPLQAAASCCKLLSDRRKTLRVNQDSRMIDRLQCVITAGGVVMVIWFM